MINLSALILASFLIYTSSYAALSEKESLQLSQEFNSYLSSSSSQPLETKELVLSFLKSSDVFASLANEKMDLSRKDINKAISPLLRADIKELLSHLEFEEIKLQHQIDAEYVKAFDAFHNLMMLTDFLSHTVDKLRIRATTHLREIIEEKNRIIEQIELAERELKDLLPSHIRVPNRSHSKNKNREIVRQVLSRLKNRELAWIEKGEKLAREHLKKMIQAAISIDNICKNEAFVLQLPEFAPTLDSNSLKEYSERLKQAQKRESDHLRKGLKFLPSIGIPVSEDIIKYEEASRSTFIRFSNALELTRKLIQIGNQIQAQDQTLQLAPLNDSTVTSPDESHQEGAEIDKSLNGEVKTNVVVSPIGVAQSEEVLSADINTEAVKTENPQIKPTDKGKDKKLEKQPSISATHHPILHETEGNWTVNHRYSAKKANSLLGFQFVKFEKLMKDISESGPVQPDWKNFSRLAKSDYYHCHLGGGKNRVIVLWKVVDREKKIIDVFYVGSHPTEYKKFLK